MDQWQRSQELGISWPALALPDGEDVTIHPSTITLRAAAQCAFRIMRAGVDGIPEEAIAQALAEYFYDHFRVIDTSGPALLFARVSLTEALCRLAPALQARLRERHRGIDEQTQCCVLSGSCGQYGEWCRVTTPTMDHCMVVDDAAFRSVRPVVAEVLRGLDGNLTQVGRWEGAGLLEDLDRAVHVVHIEEAMGHPLLQGQAEFVAHHGVRSMIGLGGRLPSGRSVCVELVLSVPVGPERLSHYRVLALSVYLAFLRADLMTIAEHTQRQQGPANAQAVVLQHVLTAKMQGQERILALYERGAVDRAYLASVNAEELGCLLNRLLITEDLHRRQLSLDLHDEVTSKLGSVIFGMGNMLASPPAASQDMLEQLARFREELVRLSAWTRTKAHELHPAVLTHLGLVDALKRLALEYGQRMGITVAVHVKGTVPQDPIISTTLYRVVQEALRNIEKHAHASQVVVSLRQDGERLRVSIEDNGVGFSQEGASRELQGIGLLGMEERVRMISGTFSIVSQIGEGTKLELLVPAQLLYVKRERSC